MKEKVKDILREHVHRHEYQVDPAEIWAGMQNEIKKEEKKRKRPIWRWFFAIGLLLLVALLFSDTGIDTEKNNQISEYTPSGINQNFDNTLSELTSKEDEIFNTPALGFQDDSNNLSESNTIESSNEIGDITVDLISPNQSSGEANSINSKINKKFKSSNNGLTSKAKNNLSTSFNSANEKSLFSDFIKTTKSVLPLEKNKQQEDAEDTQSNEFVPSDKLIIEEARASIDEFGSLMILAAGELTYVSKDRFAVDEDMFDLIDVKELKRKRTSISVIASAGLFTKKLVANNEVNALYANERSKYENPLEQVSVQALVTLPIAGKFSLSSGLQYLNINEEFNWSGNYFVDGMGNYINPDTETLIGTNYSQEVNHELTKYNQSKIISLPILVGLAHTHKRLSYGIKAGVNLKLSSETNGDVLDLNLIPTNISDFNHEFGLGFQSKFELGYMLAPGFEVVGDFSMNRWTAKEDLLSQRLQSYMLGVGLRKNL